MDQIPDLKLQAITGTISYNEYKLKYQINSQIRN